MTRRWMVFNHKLHKSPQLVAYMREFYGSFPELQPDLALLALSTMPKQHCGKWRQFMLERHSVDVAVIYGRYGEQWRREEIMLGDQCIYQDELLCGNVQLSTPWRMFLIQEQICEPIYDDDEFGTMPHKRDENSIFPIEEVITYFHTIPWNIPTRRLLLHTELLVKELPFAGEIIEEMVRALCVPTLNDRWADIKQRILREISKWPANRREFAARAAEAANLPDVLATVIVHYL